MAEMKALVQAKIDQLKYAATVMKSVHDAPLTTTEDSNFFEKMQFKDVKFLLDNQKFIVAGLIDLAKYLEETRK